MHDTQWVIPYQDDVFLAYKGTVNRKLNSVPVHVPGTRTIFHASCLIPRALCHVVVVVVVVMSVSCIMLCMRSSTTVGTMYNPPSPSCCNSKSNSNSNSNSSSTAVALYSIVRVHNTMHSIPCPWCIPIPIPLFLHNTPLL